MTIWGCSGKDTNASVLAEATREVEDSERFPEYDLTYSHEVFNRTLVQLEREEYCFFNGAVGRIRNYAPNLMKCLHETTLLFELHSLRNGFDKPIEPDSADSP